MFTTPSLAEMDRLDTIDAMGLNDLMVFRQQRPRERRRIMDIDLSASLLGVSFGPEDHDEEVNMLLRPGLWADHFQKATSCQCKGKCMKKCPCLKKQVKCREGQCKCSISKCENRFQKAAAVNSDAYSDLESGESVTSESSGEDEAIVDEASDQSLPVESLRGICCSCEGTCKCGCPCKNADQMCSTNLCACSGQKCSKRLGASSQLAIHGEQGSTKKRKRMQPSEMKDAQSKHAESAYEYYAKEKCSSLDKEEIIKRICFMAKFSPLLWQKVDTVFRVEMEKEICDEAQGVDPFDEEQICSSRNMDWCICGHCREMQNEKEQVCCRNKELNHEHPFFDHHVLCEQSLELAMRNNADHLHYTFDPSNPAC
eukprot:Seg1181.4 transcript_id=Seg1181.4/GoldUCD/mRNA.D3Y31 product="hypothetical protein" protein_id=Seg1181.4/GoldUCD/D3Y31